MQAPADEVAGDVDERADDLREGARGTSDDVLRASSDFSVSMIMRGIVRTKPISPPSAPWNQAQARAMALPFLMFSQISSWPISFMKPPIRVSAVRGTGSPVIGSSPRIALEQIVAARALRQRGQRLQDGVLHHLEDFDDDRAAEGRSAGRWAR